MTFEILYFVNPSKPSEEKFIVASKAGYLFMNRAAVDEEDKCEILKIFKLEEASRKMWYSKHPEYEKFEFQRKHKGMIFYRHNDIYIVTYYRGQHIRLKHSFRLEAH